MKLEIRVPKAGESVTEARISQWFKQDGDRVEKDDVLLEFETDKANQDYFAEGSGTLRISVAEGEDVVIDQVVGYIETSASADNKAVKHEDRDDPAAAKMKQAESPAPDSPPKAAQSTPAHAAPSTSEKTAQAPLSPAVRRIFSEHDLQPETVKGSGKDGRILKEDALKAVAGQDEPQAKPAKSDERSPKSEAPSVKPESGPAPAAAQPSIPVSRSSQRGERAVPMTMMRRRIAQRLVEAQQTAAILTTFNEVDMTPVMELRERYKESFTKKYGVRLGFMSFFVKASIEALKFVPEINGRIEGNQTIYYDYFDIGVAVGTEKGLVVPVIRDADQLGFAGIEQTINDFGARARVGKITPDDLSGGTFTISNGGIYGSLLSTPILNPPQSGILGMHKIEKRAVVVDDQIVIRPMMYLALSYDHRIVDGKGAVTFLVKIKECLEDPARMLLEI